MMRKILSIAAIPLFAIGLLTGIVTRPATPESPADSHPGGQEKLAAALRHLDPAEALRVMEDLAYRNPQAFFRELPHFPRLQGLEELISIAARQLAATETPEHAADLLNTVPNVRMRTAAWIAYLSNVTGLSPVEKIKMTLNLAKASSPQQIGYDAVLVPGMAADPEGTLAALKKADLMDAFCEAMGILDKTNPALAAREIGESLADGKLKSNAAQFSLEAMAMSNPSPAALKEIAAVISQRSYVDGIYLGPIFGPAFAAAKIEDKAAVIDIIATLPTMQKNQVLQQLSLADCPDSATAAKLLNAMDSFPLQQRALQEWKSSGVTGERLRELAPLLTSERTRAGLISDAGGE